MGLRVALAGAFVMTLGEGAGATGRRAGKGAACSTKPRRHEA